MRATMLPLPVDAFGGALHPAIEAATAWKLPMRYSLDLVGLEGLAALGFRSRADVAALFALVSAPIFIHRHRSKVYSVLTRGYLLFENWVLRQHVCDVLECIPPTLNVALKDADLTSADAILSQLAEVDDSAWPLRAGPIVRYEGSGVCLDLATASARLDTIESPETSGAAAKPRSTHFEKAVQDLIQSSSWRASPDLARVRGPTLRINNQAITDIDAIGERGGCLLLVSCKSIVQRAEYQTGSHRVIRNAATNLEVAVNDWKLKLAAFKETPRGDNFDFSRFTRLVGVVCVPAVIWAPVGVSMELVLPGLCAAVSYGEFEDWLRNP
jgi:hypothetical protein